MQAVTTEEALLPQHGRMLEVSAIRSDVIADRGYASITVRPVLLKYGFAGEQLIVPTLLIPVHSIHGGIALYQHRPDTPRLSRDGKAIKYETLAGARMALDVQPRIRPLDGDPKTPLWITEGIKKADAAISAGLCCIGLLGVWNWRGANALGGKTALPDWECVALNGREVVICFDSDVMVKTSVQEALARLSEFLASRGAKVKYAYLPDGEGGAKVGLDDYIAEGKSVDDLKSLVTNQIRSASSPAHLKPLRERVIDLADVPPPPAELPLLFGPYLVEGATHWLTGATGIGKSTIGFNIVTALVEGTELWGIPCKPRRVLYVDLESGDIGRSLKLKRLYQDRARPRERLYFIGDGINLPDELPSLLSIVADNGIDLVVLDTARRCFRVKDENDNAEVYARVVPVLDALKAAGVASLVFGHPAKHDAAKARGAGAQEDAGDVNLSLTIHSGESGSRNAIVALKVTKHRLLGLDNPPLYLRRIGNDRFERVKVEEEPSAPSEPYAQGRCAADLIDNMEALGRKPAPYGHLVSAMKTKGHAVATVKRTIQRLKTDGTIEKTASGYILSDPFRDDGLPIEGGRP
jgi:hypothetical protein